MEFVLLNSWKQGLSREDREEALARRAQWEYPDGLEVIAEYWPATDHPAVVAILRADDYEALFEMELTWNDTFDVTILPAISAKEGLELGPKIMERVNA